jgi:hypothetical protein
MTIEQLLVQCRHGNRPELIEVMPRETWRAQCRDCRCGRRTTPERAPILAANRWHRANHANARLDRQEEARP